MLIRILSCVVKDITKIGLEFRFIVDQYTYQDNTQNMAIMSFVIRQIHKDFPDILEIILEYDNASCFTSYDIIPFIECFNKKLQAEKFMLAVIKLTYTEAYTGKGRVDTHFAFVNLDLQQLLLERNNILTEAELYKGISAFDGIE